MHRAAAYAMASRHMHRHLMLVSMDEEKEPLIGTSAKIQVFYIITPCCGALDMDPKKS